MTISLCVHYGIHDEVSKNDKVHNSFIKNIYLYGYLKLCQKPLNPISAGYAGGGVNLNPPLNPMFDVQI